MPDARDPLLDVLIKALIDAGVDLDSYEADGLIAESIGRVVREGAPGLKAALQASAPAMHCDHDVLRGQFESRLANRWQRPLDLLQQHLVVALELGEELNREARSGNDFDLTLEALTRLHGRACQTAQEILCLLRGGFANGAFSRWRTLHEIAVVAILLAEGDEHLSEQYLLHDAVESLRAAEQYNEHCHALGFEKEDVAEIARLRATCDALANRFGKSFMNRWGWAADAVGKSNPTFADIERAAALQRYRPYVKLASHAIHAGPKGIVFNMSASRAMPELISAGASNVGLSDPMQFCAISMTQISSAIVSKCPTIERLIAVTVLNEWSRDVADEALAVQVELDSEGIAEGRPAPSARVLHWARVSGCRIRRWVA